MEGSIVREIATALPETESRSATALSLVVQTVPEAISRFPSTRYYGSKRKLLSWMYSHLYAIPFDSVLDAFGGTASVSLLFKSMHKNVTYHDGLRFNQDVGRTVLSDRPALSQEGVEAILSGVIPSNGIISQHFSGVFFKNEENEWLDGFAAALKTDARTPEECALLRYLIYQACLKKRPFNLFHRANLHLRTNTGISRSFGNSVTWERSFIHHSLQAYNELSKTPVAGGGSIEILPPGNAECVAPGYDLVYIDPPYINLEDRYNRDDYWRRYAFLEGIARYDEWADLIDLESDIRLIAAPRWVEDWGRTRSFKERLFSFIDAHRQSIVVLSYVSGAVPSEAEIKLHFESRFSKVLIHSAEHNHALSKTPKRELLFIGYPML